MSLQTFQQALSDLTSSPELCVQARDNPKKVLGSYHLSSRELMRITIILHQRGMSTNCTLYRANRITPLYTLLPNTCFLLGKDLMRHAELFWKSYKETNLVFKQEITYFCNYLVKQIRSKTITSPFLEEILGLERAIVEFGFLSRKEISYEEHCTNLNEIDPTVRLHPLIKVVPFVHDPIVLLSYLAEVQLPPEDINRGKYYLLLDARGDDLDVRQIDSLFGQLLQEIDTGAIEKRFPLADNRLTPLIVRKSRNEKVECV